MVLHIYHIVISAHEAVTDVGVVISKQVLLLPADKAQSLCLNLAVDIDQKLMKESSHLQYVVALSHHDVVAVVLQLCEFSSILSSTQSWPPDGCCSYLFHVGTPWDTGVHHKMHAAH